LSLGKRVPGAIAPLLAVVAVVLVFLPLSPAYDLDVFLRAGYATLHGLQLYPRAGSPAVYSGSSFVYPYLAALPFAPLATMSRGMSVDLFFAISVGAVLIACLAAAHGDPWRPTLVLCSCFTITGLQLGALSPLLFAGTVFLWLLRDRPVALGLLAAAVVVSKLFLAPLLIWLLLARRWRAFAYASGFTLALLAAGFLLGPIGVPPYAHILLQLGAHEARAGFGLIGALLNAGLAPAAAHTTVLVLTAAVFAGAYLHHRRERDERVLFCAGIVGSLLLTPILWSHYLVLLAVPLLALGVRRRWFVLLALASWAVAPPHGVHLDTDLIDGMRSSGVWLAVVLVFFASMSGSGAQPVRERLDRIVQRIR
jgi:alpha-1,2-mannosyltransferase